MADASKKRKSAASNGPAAKRPRFPQNANQRRNIPSTPTSTAYPNGEINVKNFLKSHENEIKSLEGAMQAAKKGLNRRAFQQVPRELRRRTASHNPQRVPKRLRIQAKKDAKEDNTPISKGKSGSGIGKGKKKWLRQDGMEKSRQAWERRAKRRSAKKDDDVTVEPMEGVELAEERAKVSTEQPKKATTKRPKFAVLAKPEMPASRFRRRQINKTWLPTHVWHSKRAFMTPPKEPLWRFAIPLAPNVKAYRLTHRAAALRGAVAWDMSYMATICLEGIQASINGMLKGLRFADEDEDDPWEDRGRGKKWRDGTRTWEGWIYERESKPHRPIAQVTIIWCVPDVTSNNRKAFLRVHPSAFLQVWNEVIRISKVQKPAVTVEDLRFEIGSIEVMGPAAAETLCAILAPSPTSDLSSTTPQALWENLATVTNPGELPSGALLAFRISDPRLRDPPDTARMPQDIETQAALVDTLTQWPIDAVQRTCAIFSRDARLAAARSLPSQQSINRRKSACTTGRHPDPRETDPQIPILTYVSRQSKSWTVLLPWKCVPPVWRGIMRYPISTGGNPRFGGLKERRQVNFERSNPSFPFDHPGTDAGWSWELQEREAREHDWKKRPKGKRIEWTTIDLGNGRKGEVGSPWACDWERLLPHKEIDRLKGAEVDASRRLFRQLPTQDALELVVGHSLATDYLSSPHLFTVKISMSQRGTPTNCARIYRLPTNNAELRSKWLTLLPARHATAKTKRAPSRIEKDQPKHVRNQRLAASLLEPPQTNDGVPKAGDEYYPVVPDEVDLIGFVTTGNYSLAEGMPTAIANLVVQGGKTTSASHAQVDRRTQLRLSNMSEDQPADGHDGGEAQEFALPPGALVDMTKDVLEDCIQSIIEKTVLSCHRSEKLLRMQSAATQAESLALANLEPQSQKNANTSQPSVPTADTAAAKYENGRVILKGNPLKTTPEIICPHCKLPRLMHPIMGKGMHNPDLTKEYCMLYPWVQRPGHDVYGNPFPTDMAKSKKERELMKQQQKNAEKESVGTPGSQDTDMAGGETQGKEIKLNTGGKPASYIPWHTCPSCKRSLLITRFAQHLEKCLGISGRQSSRNAMAKISGQNGNGNGSTPLGSRMGTPAPGSQGDVAVTKTKAKGISPVKKLGADDDDDGDNDTPDKKKKKKSSYVKKADREKMGKDGGPIKVKLKNSNAERRTSEGIEKSEGKRDREGDSIDPDAPKAKKIKLSLGKAGSPPAPAVATQD
ncbi:ribonuclease P complex subunit Pop1 [Byssothecium circinans]|uniref:SAGA-associated factor 11 n=1 Tax=Byssothecium circinans TaxID=147558 RepID=A0A6A5UH33_9PLEO|nr:ribonuclease P complex subunit Pop1 [Byssothecium circinans]